MGVLIVRILLFRGAKSGSPIFGNSQILIGGSHSAKQSQPVAETLCRCLSPACCIPGDGAPTKYHCNVAGACPDFGLEALPRSGTEVLACFTGQDNRASGCTMHSRKPDPTPHRSCGPTWMINLRPCRAQIWSRNWAYPPHAAHNEPREWPEEAKHDEFE